MEWVRVKAEGMRKQENKSESSVLADQGGEKQMSKQLLQKTNCFQREKEALGLTVSGLKEISRLVVII